MRDLWRRSIYAAGVICLAACDSSPGSSELETVLVEEYGQVVSVADVTRTNGVAYPGGDGSPERYALEYTARLVPPGPVTIHVSGGLERAVRGGALIKAVTAGHTADPQGLAVFFDVGTSRWRTDQTRPADIYGTVLFMRTENGWRMEEAQAYLTEATAAMESMAPRSVAGSSPPDTRSAVAGATGTSPAAVEPSRVDPSVCETTAGSDTVIGIDAGGEDTYVGDVYSRTGEPSNGRLSFGGWGDHYYVYLRFPLVATGVEQPRTAVLCLFTTDLPPNDPRLELGVVTESWDARNLSIVSRPTHQALGPFGTLVAGWNAVDVTTVVQEWIDGTRPNNGISLSPGANNQTNGGFASAEAADPAQRPRLVLRR